MKCTQLPKSPLLRWGDVRTGSIPIDSVFYGVFALFL